MTKPGIVPEAIAFPLVASKTVRGVSYTGFQVHDAQGAWIATTGDMPYAAYIAHAANAYPKLVEALRRLPQLAFHPSNNGESWDAGYKAGFFAAMERAFELSQKTLRDVGEES